ncbi:EAL domain-containing protein [Ectothiorhodospiraceae bacterium 2226]|nr:EAL domain-containing protein [Ectothiorhodospiraceae bacterium 2226]
MSAEQFLRLADGLPEALLLVARDGTVLSVNRAAGRLLGLPRACSGDLKLHALVDNPPAQIDKLLRDWTRSSQPLPAPIRWRPGRAGDLSGWRCTAFTFANPGDAARGHVVLRCQPGRTALSDFQALNRELARQQATLRKLHASREALERAHENALVTLMSIGDAVIATDARARVETMNPVAEALTGWPQHEAAGKPLGEVFRIVNEFTREPALDPVARCIAEGRTVGLASHTALLARDGTEYVVENSAAPIRRRDGEIIGVVLVFRDVTEDRLAQRQLHYLAQHDALTALYNRHYFERELERAVQVARRGALRYAMLYVDLDQFKVVNDTEGHAVGDELLREVGSLLGQRVRKGDLIARLGGDEFGLLLTDVSRREAMEFAHELLQRVKGHRFARHGVDYEISASIGIAMVGSETSSAAEALRFADIACYIAKRNGRSRVHMYDDAEEVNVATVGEMQLVNALRHALANDAFELHFQPIVHIASGETRGYEVLLRMRRPDGTLLPPGAFIPIAERYGLMTEIDLWVVPRALRALEDADRRGQPIALSVNLSGSSLGDAAALAAIKKLCRALRVPAARVTFEITETAAIAVVHIERAQAFMRELQGLGCRFALDDFGTGFSSFAYLKCLPVDIVKIDGTFVRDILSDPVDQAMVRSLNQIAHSLGKETVAEFVESEAVLACLREFGVDHAQGYYLGRPGPAIS